VLVIYDEIYKQESFQHILVRHEQAAVHAADAYARATGRPGVALVTSGPGVTNAVTGIATAYMDSIPMVIITGQVPTYAIGQDAFQECDTVGITRPCVKHNFLVKDVADLATTLKKAFFIATTGRPGPVVVDIPKDVSMAKTPFHYPETVEMRSYRPVNKGHSGQIKKAMQLLLNAERPMIYIGGGAILGDASALVTELVRHLGSPCTNTLMGLGAYPASDRQFLGMLGMHGTVEANMAMQNCDVLIAIGAQDHPYRYRPLVDLQTDQGRCADRRQHQGCGHRAAGPAQGRRAKTGQYCGLVEADRGMARQGLFEIQDVQRNHQAPVCGAKTLAGDERRCDRNLGRRSTSDVGGAVLPFR
jgi:thiamine pyrophosphate-dependent acetolactate synthase large subunit-like protein